MLKLLTKFAFSKTYILKSMKYEFFGYDLIKNKIFQHSTLFFHIVKGLPVAKVIM